MPGPGERDHAMIGSGVILIDSFAARPMGIVQGERHRAPEGGHL